jgi:hypothetical protein
MLEAVIPASASEHLHVERFRPASGALSRFKLSEASNMNQYVTFLND